MHHHCLRNGHCLTMIPALQDVENHFEERISNIEELKTTLGLMEGILPGDSETRQQLSEASSMINNFYIFIEFLFSDIPNVYNIIVSTSHSDSRSSSETILSAVFLTAFRFLMITSLFIIAPKNIWRLHLFVIKSVIILLILVLCLESCSTLCISAFARILIIFNNSLIHLFLDCLKFICFFVQRVNTFRLICLSMML